MSTLRCISIIYGFSDPLPPSYSFLQISLAEEFIRLHRPWLVLAAANPIYQYSRDQVLKHSRLLLALYRTPSCVKQIWGGLTYKATGVSYFFLFSIHRELRLTSISEQAAIVLAVEILTFPDGSDADSLRAWVRSTALQLESHREVSVSVFLSIILTLDY